MSLKYRRTASLNLTALGWHTTLPGKEFQSIIVLGKKLYTYTENENEIGMRSDINLGRCLRQPLLIHCWSHLSHPTLEQHMALMVVTDRVSLRPRWFFHIPTREETTISTWSSKPREGLTICRCHSKGSTFVLSTFNTLSVGLAGNLNRNIPAQYMHVN